MKIPKKMLALSLSLMLTLAFTPSSNALSNIDNIKGKDKYETAAKIAEKQKYTKVILVNLDKSLADGLSASGLSGSVKAPILLTKKGSIPNVTLDKLKGVTKVYIIGGESSVDKNVEQKIKQKGIEVKRIKGEDRVQTSYNVAREIDSINHVKKVILTNGFKGEADAMTVAPVAVRDGVPILLTNGNSAPFNGSYMESYAIGGVNSISDKLVKDTNSTRIGGINRFDTNKKIINKFYPGVKNFYIVKSDNLVDALTGSFIAKDMPIVLVDKGSDKSILKNSNKVTSLGTISDSIIQECLNITNGIGNTNTGTYTVEDAANVVKKLIGVNKFYYDINDSLKGEDAIFLIDKNYILAGKKYFVFGRIKNNAVYDDRYCVEQDDMSKVSIYNSDGVMKPYNPNY